MQFSKSRNQICPKLMSLMKVKIEFIKLKVCLAVFLRSVFNFDNEKKKSVFQILEKLETTHL